MRALQFSAFGGPEVLTIQDVPTPVPSSGQVRVAVRYVGTNPADSKIRAGQMGNPPLPHRVGLEMAGIVDAIGEIDTTDSADTSHRTAAGNSTFSIGDEVFGWARGGAGAEYALATQIAPKPAGLSWRDAAALPVAGEAAIRGLRFLAVGAGDVLLIHGASGAVGSLAVQLAVSRGATVVGTTGESGAEFVRSLGAIPVRYGTGLVARVRAISDRIDAVLDAAGFGALEDSIALRDGTDRIVTLADPAATDLGVAFSSGSAKDRDPAVLTELANAVVAGKLAVRHASEFPLSDAVAAYRDLDSGHTGGKITLSTTP